MGLFRFRGWLRNATRGSCDSCWTQSAGAGWDKDVPVEGAIVSVDGDVNQYSVVKGGPPGPAVAPDAVTAVSRPDVVEYGPQSPTSPGALLGKAAVAGVARDDGDLDAVRWFLLDVGVERRLVEGASYAEFRGYFRGRMNL